MSTGRINRTKAKTLSRVPRAPRASVSEYAETAPTGLYGAIIIPEADRVAVARLCARREGADSEVARMLDVAGVLS